jgi:hypothetical protein
MINTTNLDTPCVLQLREKKRNTCEDKFETIILEAVDEIFSSFGRSCKKAIYFQLEHTFKIRKQDILFKIEDFANALEQIFGVGAKFIELKIIEILHQKTPNFKYSPQIKDLVFAEYVENLRRFFIAIDCERNKCLPSQRKRATTQLLQNKPYCLFQ